MASSLAKAFWTSCWEKKSAIVENRRRAEIAWLHPSECPLRRTRPLCWGEGREEGMGKISCDHARGLSLLMCPPLVVVQRTNRTHRCTRRTSCPAHAIWTIIEDSCPGQVTIVGGHHWFPHSTSRGHHQRPHTDKYRKYEIHQNPRVPLVKRADSGGSHRIRS